MAATFYRNQPLAVSDERCMEGKRSVPLLGFVDRGLFARIHDFSAPRLAKAVGHGKYMIRHFTSSMEPAGLVKACIFLVIVATFKSLPALHNSVECYPPLRQEAWKRNSAKRRTLHVISPSPLVLVRVRAILPSSSRALARSDDIYCLVRTADVLHLPHYPSRDRRRFGFPPGLLVGCRGRSKTHDTCSVFL